MQHFPASSFKLKGEDDELFELVSSACLWGHAFLSGSDFGHRLSGSPSNQSGCFLAIGWSALAFHLPFFGSLIVAEPWARLCCRNQLVIRRVVAQKEAPCAKEHTSPAIRPSVTWLLGGGECRWRQGAKVDESAKRWHVQALQLATRLFGLFVIKLHVDFWSGV